MAFYTKDDEGNLTEVNADDMFKDRHERWVKTESEKVRDDVTASIREELTPTITSELEEKFKSEYQTKLDEANSQATKLQTQLLQTTIAAEYGFKRGTEKYLGEGTEEEMRKEADTLKKSFGASGGKPPRDTKEKVSKTQEKNGIKVEI